VAAGEGCHPFAHTFQLSLGELKLSSGTFALFLHGVRGLLVCEAKLVFTLKLARVQSTLPSRIAFASDLFWPGE